MIKTIYLLGATILYLLGGYDVMRSVQVEIPIYAPYCDRVSVLETDSGKEMEDVKLDDGNGLLVMTYDVPGEYHYSLCQKGLTRSDVSYDNKQYDLTVWIGSKEDGELYSMAYLFHQGSDEKYERALFNNLINTPDTSDETDINRTLIMFCVSMFMCLAGLYIRKGVTSDDKT